MKRSNILIPVEYFVNISDPTIMWFRIPGFPGYEISSNGFVRSFKQRKKYKYGNLIKCNKDKFILSNDNNQRIELSAKEIWTIIYASGNPIPIHTWEVENKSRNPRMTILPDEETEVGKLIKKPKPVRDEPISFADFSNIPNTPLE